MQVALMIPCYIDVFYPEVGIATLELLEKLKVDVAYPFDQTCCGQPMANSGCFEESRATEELFIKNFSDFEYIVTPSGSCTHHVRHKFTAVPDSPERRKVSASVYDLVEFLHDILKVSAFPWARFEHKVALHTSCSAIRGLGLASMSERVHDPKFSKPQNLDPEGICVPVGEVRTQSGFTHQLFGDPRPRFGFDERTRARPKIFQAAESAGAGSGDSARHL